MRVGGPSIGVVDYGMGNRRSAEKALEHVGARVEVSADPERLRAMDGLVLPGVGAFPAGMAAIRAAGLDELLHERVEAGVPLLGLCLGMQLLFERSEEHDGASGLGLLAGTVRRLNAPGLKLPHIGWSELRWLRPTPLSEGLPDPAYLYHVHSFAAVAGRRGRGAGDRRLRRAVRCDRRAGKRVRHAVAPGEVLRTRAGAAWQLHPLVRPRRGTGVILYPAIDILDGSAVRLVKGDFDAKKVYDEDPLSAARGWTEAGARYLHVVDLDGAKTGVPVNLEHLRRIAGELGVPVQYGGGSALGEAVCDAAGGGRRARDPRYGRVHRRGAA